MFLSNNIQKILHVHPFFRFEKESILEMDPLDRASPEVERQNASGQPQTEPVP